MTEILVDTSTPIRIMRDPGYTVGLNLEFEMLAPPIAATTLNEA
jgi:hypothetical protein